MVINVHFSEMYSYQILFVLVLSSVCLLDGVTAGDCHEEKGGARTAMGKVSALLVIKAEENEPGHPGLGIAVILSPKVLLTSSYNFYIGDQAKRVTEVVAYAGITKTERDIEDWKEECDQGLNSGMIVSFIWGYTRCQAKPWDAEKGVIIDGEDARRRKKDERLALIFLKFGFHLSENVFPVYMDRFSKHSFPPSTADCNTALEEDGELAVCQSKDDTRLHVTSEQLVCSVNSTKVCTEILAGVQCCPRLRKPSGLPFSAHQRRYLCMLTGPYLHWIVDQVDLYKSTPADREANSLDIKDPPLGDEHLVFGQQVAYALRGMERYASAKAKLEMQKILFKYNSGNPDKNE